MYSSTRSSPQSSGLAIRSKFATYGVEAVTLVLRLEQVCSVAGTSSARTCVVL